MSLAWEIKHAIEKNNNNLDVEKIMLAYELAKEAHRGQLRKSGEEYIIHPIEVAKILIEMNMDTDTIIAGLLHDVIEDTLIQPEDIRENFGEVVARLVEGVTKLKNLPEGTSKQSENIRKMIVAMAKDIRVVIIKLADRLHNMRTLKHMPSEKRERIAGETIRIFAPLAHRLGMSKIKQELEDLSLYYLKPDIYRNLVEMVSFKRKEREEYTEDVIENLKTEMKKYEIHGEVTGRAKHFYSIYKKMYEKGKQFDEIYDLIAVRVLTDTDAECYNVLGIAHNLWKPVPGRFKDYIAVPKSNGYQSIHTTIIGPNGSFVEIQIRTKEMHMIAEDGIAAHWKYKENTGPKKNDSDNVYSWLKKILEWQKESESSEEFIAAVTNDILSDEVFVFSPKGEVIELPLGSTPLDFAFFIHTEVGHRCVGAKVNDKIVPLDYNLRNGDRIEIITSKAARGPGSDWINMVVTHGAKAKIRRWFKEKEFEDKVKEGKSLLEKELAMLNIRAKEIADIPEIIDYIRKHNLPNYDELLFQIGSGTILAANISSKLRKAEENELLKDITDIKKPKKRSDQGIIIEGIDNTVIRYAKCCTPLPGDNISGYISRGKGVTIHREDCRNYQDLVKKDPERIIRAYWDDAAKVKSDYSFSFNVLVEDRVNLLMDLIKVISEHKINILGVNSVSFKENGAKLANIRFTIEIKEKEQYNKLIQNIKRLQDVIEVKRI